jgi:hypothetical protein
MAKKVECKKYEVVNGLDFTQNEFEFLTDFFKDEEQASPLEVITLVNIFNRVYSKKEDYSPCDSCLRDLLNILRDAFNSIN